jgi:hypothetical protein
VSEAVQFSDTDVPSDVISSVLSIISEKGKKPPTSDIIKVFFSSQAEQVSDIELMTVGTYAASPHLQGRFHIAFTYLFETPSID